METTLNSQADKRVTRAKRLRKERKEQILKVAIRLLGEKGFQSTSVADVIEAAQISRGTFYLYFESREALFNELLDGFISDLKNSVQAIELADRDPIGKLYENLIRVLSLLEQHQDLTTILLREAVGNAHLEFVQEKLGQLYAFLHRMVSGALVNGAKLGLTRKVNEDLMAVAVIGSFKEVIYQYWVEKRPNPPSPDIIAKELIELGIRGLQNR